MKFVVLVVKCFSTKYEQIQALICASNIWMHQPLTVWWECVLLVADAIHSSMTSRKLKVTHSFLLENFTPEENCLSDSIGTGPWHLLSNHAVYERLPTCSGLMPHSLRTNDLIWHIWSAAFCKQKGWTAGGWYFCAYSQSCDPGRKRSNLKPERLAHRNHLHIRLPYFTL